MNVEMSGMFLENLFLLFVRTVSLFSSAPIFGQRNIPAQVRIGLAGLMSYVLLQASPNSIASMPDSIGYYALLVSNEVIFGLLLGFIATLAVTGLTMAGTLIGNALGLNAAQLLSPMTGQQVTLMDQFYTMIAGLVFLSIDGHHWLIMAVAETLRVAPVGSFQVDPTMLADLMPLSSAIFVAGMRIALPVFGTVILTDVGLAVVARAVPQMNIFIVGLPLKVLVGLGAMIVTLPLMGPTIVNIITDGMAHLEALVHAGGQ